MKLQKKNYRINSKYSLILKADGNLLCVDTSKNIVKFKIDDCEFANIEKIFNNDIFNVSSSKIFRKLLAHKIIVEDKNKENYELYLNQLLNTNINSKELEKKTIAIIGLGGIGCEILNHLLGVGISRYILIDYDKVEITNFNRQYIFNNNDIAKNKVEVIEKYINSKIKDSKIEKVIQKINNANELTNILKEKHVDIIICAADSPFLDIRIAVIETSIILNIPCVFGGVNIMNGQFGPLLFQNSKMKKYLKELLKFKSLVKLSSTNKASFGPTNTLIAAYMAMDIILFLINTKNKIKSLNKIVTLNFESGNIYETKQF